MLMQNINHPYIKVSHIYSQEGLKLFSPIQIKSENG